MLQKANEAVEGKVIESLPNAMFKVETADGQIVLCTLSGKMRINHIRVLPGDGVKFETTPYDANKGRIIYRTK